MRWWRAFKARRLRARVAALERALIGREADGRVLVLEFMYPVTEQLDELDGKLQLLAEQAGYRFERSERRTTHRLVDAKTPLPPTDDWNLDP